MTITKELWEQFKITSIVLKEADKDTMCFPKQYAKHIWSLYVPALPCFHYADPATMQITFFDGYIGVFQVQVLKANNDYCSVMIPKATADRRVQSFIDMLDVHDKRDMQYEKRKESRIIVGKSNSSAFGLVSPQQTLFVHDIYAHQPCAIVDASIHGICIITLHTNNIEDERAMLHIKLHFKLPEQHIILRCQRVHTRRIEPGKNTYAMISCRIVEPIHFIWKERVMHFMEKMTCGN